ncbi:hypothetical protein [Halobacteriaceae bacterium SHR40]|uniref:hypothetical protein n=1 Tax=Halovenus amylolytica TaxID=2500550 RepID=UPI000FE3EEC5
MSVARSGEGWTVEIHDGVMIWEFLPGMELEAFRDDAYPVFEDLLDSHRIEGMVTVVKLDDPFTGAVFDIWEKSATRADERGVDRWAVVADGIKAISLGGKIDTADLETYRTEDRTEAVEWARSD